MSQVVFFLTMYLGLIILLCPATTSAPHRHAFLFSWATCTSRRYFPCIYLQEIWSIAKFLLVRNAQRESTTWNCSLISFFLAIAMCVYYLEFKGDPNYFLLRSSFRIMGGNDEQNCISGKVISKPKRSYISKSGQSILRLIAMRY